MLSFLVQPTRVFYLWPKIVADQKKFVNFLYIAKHRTVHEILAYGHGKDE